MINDAVSGMSDEGSGRGSRDGRWLFEGSRDDAKSVSGGIIEDIHIGTSVQKKADHLSVNRY